jgi:hypothetical protein
MWKSPNSGGHARSVLQNKHSWKSLLHGAAHVFCTDIAQAAWALEIVGGNSLQNPVEPSRKCLPQSGTLQ